MSGKLAFVSLTALITAAVLLAALPLCVAQNEARLPSDFPKEIPLYKNARFVKSGNWMDNPKLGRNYWFDTADAVDAVIGFYKAQLPSNGWTITRNSFVANPNTITVMKGKQMVLVSPNRASGNNGVEVTRIEIILMAQ